MKHFFSKYDQFPFRLVLSFMFLIFSIMSIGLLLFPLVIAQFFSLTQSNIQTNSSPTPTPIAYNSQFNPEKNPLYPITDFRIEIPKIHLESEIVDNVDPNLEDDYKEKLQFGVAHAKGSYLPPEKGGPTYLFAHSTDTVYNIARYNAKFFSVRELVGGDIISVYFNHKKYDYVVREKMVIDPKDVSIVQNAQTDLILQTCWPPGTDWQRLIVFADRLEPTI